MNNKNKRCSRCKEIKPIDDFGNLKRSKDGKGPTCKSCANKASQKWKEANPDRVKDYNEKWNKANPDHNKEKSESYKLPYYIIYCLSNYREEYPGKHYAGLTHKPYKRWAQHKFDGNDTSNWYILECARTLEEAEIIEEKYHNLGYHGRASDTAIRNKLAKAL